MSVLSLEPVEPVHLGSLSNSLVEIFSIFHFSFIQVSKSIRFYFDD